MIQRGLQVSLALGGVIVLMACCPVPFWRDVSVRPGMDLDVRTHEGKPADGVKLTVRRITAGPPPDAETHRWTAKTAADGTLRLDAIEANEMYAPLMMHGVNWYAWDVCAEHPKYGVATAHHSGRTPIEPDVTLTLTLDTTVPSCDWRVLEDWSQDPVTP